MRMLDFLRAVSVFENFIRFLETGDDIALLGVIDAQYVTVFLLSEIIAVEPGLGLSALTVQNRSAWLHRRGRIEHRRQRFILDLDQLHRFFRNVLLLCRHRRDDITDVSHPIHRYPVSYTHLTLPTSDLV